MGIVVGGRDYSLFSGVRAQHGSAPRAGQRLQSEQVNPGMVNGPQLLTRSSQERNGMEFSGWTLSLSWAERQGVLVPAQGGRCHMTQHHQSALASAWTYWYYANTGRSSLCKCGEKQLRQDAGSLPRKPPFLANATISEEQLAQRGPENCPKPQ